MLKRMRFAILLGTASLIGTGTCAATDFTFVIPVSVHNLSSEVARIGTNCEVWTVARGGIEIGQGTPQYGNIVGGAFGGDITVQFNALAGRDPALGAYYHCNAWFLGTAPVGGVAAMYFAYPSSPTFPVAAGAPFVIDTGWNPVPH